MEFDIFDNIKINILNSGSNGNSTVLETNFYNLIIDIGLSKKDFFNRAKNLNINFEKTNILFLTHFHDDHIKGFFNIVEKIKPIIFVSDLKYFYDFQINYKIKKKNTSPHNYINNIINENINKVVQFEFNKRNKIKNIDNFYFVPIPTFHDDYKSSSFFFEINGIKILYLTDTGKIDNNMFKLGLVSDIIFLESNYDEDLLIKGSYPLYLKNRIKSDYGHLSNKQAIQYIKNLINERKKDENFKNFLLCHISENNNNLESIEKTIIENLEVINIDKLTYKNDNFEIKIIQRNNHHSFILENKDKKIKNFISIENSN